MVTFLEISPETKQAHKSCNDNVYLFTQFFLHGDNERRNEILYCLQNNVRNKSIHRIILLNERIYSDEELGVVSEKIIQVNIGKRLLFSDIFEYVFETKIQGYIIIANVDIFFSQTFSPLYGSDIHEEKKMFSLLRHEYRGNPDLSKASLFGSKMSLLETMKNEHVGLYNQIINSQESPNETFVDGARADSWDAWIIHTNFMITPKQNAVFKFALGMPGCDNKLIYLFRILGYEIYNDPLYFPIYHYHRTQKRSYTSADRVDPPYGLYIPARTSLKSTPGSLGVHIQNVLKQTDNLKYLHFSNDNLKLKDYIESKRQANIPFLIPKIAGEENNFAVITRLMSENKIPKTQTQLLRHHIMKTNAGIKISSFQSAENYSRQYLSAFEHAEIYSVWEPWGKIYGEINQSHDYVTSTFQKQQVWARTFDIYHYLHNPWTWSLKGLRLLIVSPFEDSIREKVSERSNIYGVDLFPECNLVFIKPPQTQGDQDSREFSDELKTFYEELETKKDLFDVALFSSGGYGNLVCDYIYTHMGKSAIYVGGVLQMYFGIYGTHCLRESKDVLRLYLNDHWTHIKQI
tara:strand:- start:546 stop:2270 length:1725 start_codon:yes stop_codon:yes gene_type:complete